MSTELTDTHDLGGAYAETMQKAAATKAEESQQLRETAFADAYGDSIAPPFPPARLAKLIENNTTHAKAGFSKARNVAGYGIEIVPHPEVDDPDESQRKTAEAFWFSGDSDWQVGPSESELSTATDVLEMAWADFEFIGWFALEVLTQTDGAPTGLAYVPAPTVRKREDKPGFVQERHGELQYFGGFGDRYADTGGSGRTFVDGDSGRSGPSVSGDVANEIVWKRNHTPFETDYGTPDIIPAIPDVVGAQEARDYNIDFFKNNTVPRMAVIVEGGQLTEGAREDIHELFHGLRDKDHSTAVLEVEKLLDDPSKISMDDDASEVRISVEPLTVGENEDASFLDYQHHTEHEIAKAHEVPPIEIGTIESGAFSTDAQAQRKSYIETTIQPKQESLSELLYETVHSALGVTDYIPQFQTRGVDTRLTDAEVAKTKAEAAGGVETVDERRGWLGLEPFGGTLGETPVAMFDGAGGAGGVGGADPSDTQEQARSERRTERLMERGKDAADE